MDTPFIDNKRCFVCGKANAAGLQIEYRVDPERGESHADVVIPERFQGWENVVHGGILATILDEAMIYAAGSRGHKCVTGEMTVRFVKPAATETGYRLTGRFIEDKGRIVLAESVLLDGEGQEVAKAAGKLFKIRE
jgi:uncharacterized protein (TIGR00369 family)